ncbi:MAG: hypothetical protein ACXIVQ_10960 [Acidimicrobiales bacterium]
MQSVDELTIAAVRSAMAPGYDVDEVAADLVARAQRNITALRLARARVERGAGWRSGPIGQRARDALIRAMELALHPADPIDLTDTALPESIDLTERASRSTA